MKSCNNRVRINVTLMKQVIKYVPTNVSLQGAYGLPTNDNHMKNVTYIVPTKFTLMNHVT
jgi:hypothetical protein